MNNKVIVFDTTCFFCLLQKENGWQIVKDYLVQAFNKELEILLSQANYCEILYQIKRSDDYSIIRQNLDNLPIKIIDIDSRITEIASDIKSQGKISLGDSYAIATAIFYNCLVLTSDRHEFQVFENQVQIEWLR